MTPTDDAHLTLQRAWDETADVIGDRQHARWMLEVATGLNPDEFLAARGEPLTERMVAHLDAMVARYRGGEPLQYVLGEWGFRHLDVAVDSRVLIPRPETEFVAEVAIAKALEFTPRRVLDLGTGSGVIGLAMASELPVLDTEVWMTDVSDAAVDVARANLAGIGRAAANVTIVTGNWFRALDGTPAASTAFDVIVSNPPYVVPGDADRSVDEWEPHIALYGGADGLAAYRAIVSEAPDHMASGSWLVFEIGERQGAAVAELMANRGLAKIQILPDLAGRDRVALATWLGHAT